MVDTVTVAEILDERARVLPELNRLTEEIIHRRPVGAGGRKLHRELLARHRALVKLFRRARSGGNVPRSELQKISGQSPGSGGTGGRAGQPA